MISIGTLLILTITVLTYRLIQSEKKRKIAENSFRELESKVNKLELQTLESKLSPHFIFEDSLSGKVLGFTTKFINPENLLNQITGKENLFEDSPFDERTRSIINKTKIPVGVFINKGFKGSDHILIPVFSKKDIILIEYAKKLINNNESQIVFWDIRDIIKNESEIKEHICMIEMKMPNHISILNNKLVDKGVLKTKNLMIISSDSWKNLIETRSLWLSEIPSTLIIRN